MSSPHGKTRGAPAQRRMILLTNLVGCADGGRVGAVLHRPGRVAGAIVAGELSGRAALGAGVGRARVGRGGFGATAAGEEEGEHEKPRLTSVEPARTRCSQRGVMGTSSFSAPEVWICQNTARCLRLNSTPTVAATRSPAKLDRAAIACMLPRMKKTKHPSRPEGHAHGW